MSSVEKDTFPIILFKGELLKMALHTSCSYNQFPGTRLMSSAERMATNAVEASIFGPGDPT